MWRRGSLANYVDWSDWDDDHLDWDAFLQKHATMAIETGMESMDEGCNDKRSCGFFFLW